MMIPKLFDILIAPAIWIGRGETLPPEQTISKPMLAQSAAAVLLTGLGLVVGLNFAPVMGTIGTGISLLTLFIFILGLNLAAAIETIAASVFMAILLPIMFFLAMKYFGGSGVKTHLLRDREKAQYYFIAVMVLAICSSGHSTGGVTPMLAVGGLLLASCRAAGGRYRCYQPSLSTLFIFK